MDWTSFLFGFQGRINRARIWLGVLAIFCWMIFVLMVAASLGALSIARAGPLADPGHQDGRELAVPVGLSRDLGQAAA